MNTYFAKLHKYDRLVAIVGSAGKGLIKAVDVNIYGEPVSTGAFVMPASSPMTEMFKGPDGFLIEGEGGDKEINWKAHESTTGSNIENDGEIPTDMSSLPPRNPALAAFPELQE